MFGNKAIERDVFEIGTQKTHRNYVGIISWLVDQKLDKGLNGNTKIELEFIPQ